MINFKLKHIDEVQPVGTDGNLRMSWFWLTDAQLWLDLGNHTLYEYTPEAIEHFGIQKTRYSQYPLVRFLEDLTEIFGHISESIPSEIYRLTDDVNGFLGDAQKWLEIYDTDDEYSDFYFEKYDHLISWMSTRSFDSGHLIGGPDFSFFRCHDQLRIVWQTVHQLENGIELWTAKDGRVEIAYIDFIHEIKDFGERFFKKMDHQVELAIEKNWGAIQIDKEQLTREHAERKEEFNEQVSLLDHPARFNTDWDMVTELYESMQKELETKV